MVGWDEKEKFPKGFVAQARQALENIVAVLAEGDARPEHIVRLTWYVLDMDEYLACRRELGAAYRAVLGDHFPAMALVQVGRLFEPEARLEIEATAVAAVAIRTQEPAIGEPAGAGASDTNPDRNDRDGACRAARDICSVEDCAAARCSFMSSDGNHPARPARCPAAG